MNNTTFQHKKKEPINLDRILSEKSLMEYGFKPVGEHLKGNYLIKDNVVYMQRYMSQLYIRLE